MFYAVAVGRKTGIYSTWKECQKQTSGFPGALHKKFTNKVDADAYIEAHSVPDSSVDIFRAYVDGSFNTEYGVYGGGAVIVSPDGNIVEEMIYHGSDIRYRPEYQIAGEALAAIMAVRFAVKACYDIEIYHDFLGISEWISGGWEAKSEVAKLYCNLYNHLTEGNPVKINFRKVSAHSTKYNPSKKNHTHEEWNDYADGLAARAVKEGIVNVSNSQ